VDYQLIEAVSQRTDRKRFLAKAGAASLAAVAGVLARPASASAWSGHGCGLCREPNNCPTSTSCYWCWTGACHGEPGNRHRHSCCEGYKAGGACDGSCGSANGFVCSVLGARRAC
jgi:hypothetical protein